MKSSSLRRIAPRLGLSAAAAALALIVPLAAAGETPQAGTADPSESTGTPAAGPEDKRSAPAAAGLVVFVDPQTGEITSEPSRAQIEALSSALKSSLSRTDEGLEPFDLAGGGRGVYLGGRFHAATVVRQGPGGTVTLECVDHPAAADAVEGPDDDEPVWEEK